MAEADIPIWLKNLPLAPEYRPTETEFADPIAFISRIEREASSFGICKVIPPFPKPSKKFVLSNLSRSLLKSPELGDAVTSASSFSESAVFTTRQQELGSRRARPAFPKQVWQSMDVYTLDQFEEKSKVFSRSKLRGFKDVTPLIVESLFWKAASEKPIYIEYANDVPGSGFAVPVKPFRCILGRRNRKRARFTVKGKEGRSESTTRRSRGSVHPQGDLVSDCDSEERNRSSGWKLSNTRWNLQVISRSPGSLTRFMPDDVPGVTSPMIYIGMLFSWFAWHVEDHELHSLNFLHMGSPKTWYAVPQTHATILEEIVRLHGYGESVDRLTAFTMLGEKTTLLSPEILVESGVPCCRLVQHPGEFVVTFPRAYHVGFSHGFNCGEAANFATPEWLKVAKEAAIRRAAMNHLPMLSHQQLLYVLTMSYATRVPRALTPGARSSRLKDRKKEQRENLIKKAFLTDMMNENYLLCDLLEKASTFAPILWEPNMLPAPCAVFHSYPSVSLDVQYCGTQIESCNFIEQKEIYAQREKLDKRGDFFVGKPADEEIALMNTCRPIPFSEPCRNQIHPASSDAETVNFDEDEYGLPVGLNADSGSLACVACGTLGYPFMAVIQPSLIASRMIFSISCEELHEKSDKLRGLIASPCVQNDACMSTAGNERGILDVADSQIESSKCTFESSSIAFCSNGLCPLDSASTKVCNMKSNKIQNDLNSAFEYLCGCDKVLYLKAKMVVPKWDLSNSRLRPRIFCLEDATEVEKLLRSIGGGHIQVICHLDYLKFKTYNASIAEEMGTEVHIKDVPLEKASKEDLSLINISIDEEEHQDDGTDWTSKLGVNLRYCAKLRKHSPTEEPLPSALSKMFSNSSAVSIASSLRWLCRKSRTPAKPSRFIAEKPKFVYAMEIGPQAMKETDIDNLKDIDVYQSRKKKTKCEIFKGCSHQVAVLESCNQNTRVSRNESMVSAIENADNLLTVPISIMENQAIAQNNLQKSLDGQRLCQISIKNLNDFRFAAMPYIESYKASDHCFHELNNTMLITVPITYQHNLSCHNISTFDNKKKNAVEPYIESNGGRGKNMELLESSDVKLLSGSTIVEIVSEPVFTNCIDSSRKHLFLLNPDEVENMQEAQTLEEQNGTGVTDFSMLDEDCAIDQRLLSIDSGRHIESPSTEKPSCAICEEEICGIDSTENGQKTKSLLLREGIVEGEFHYNQLKTSFSEKLDFDNGKVADVFTGDHGKQKGVGSMSDTKFTQTCTGSGCSPILFSVRDERRAADLNIRSYVRRKKQRKLDVEDVGRDVLREMEKTSAVQIKLEIYNNIEGQQSSKDFTRSPCEGLRPRKGRLYHSNTQVNAQDRRIAPAKAYRSKGPSLRKNGNIFKCNIEGCPMIFENRAELQFHKRYRCTHYKYQKGSAITNMQ